MRADTIALTPIAGIILILLFFLIRVKPVAPNVTEAKANRFPIKLEPLGSPSITI